MTEQHDWYLSMLGINQYRQRVPGEAVFASAASQAATPASTLPANTGGAAVNSHGGGQVLQREIVTSLAGIREALQGEPASASPAVTPVAVSEDKPVLKPQDKPAATPPKIVLVQKAPQDEQPAITEQPVEQENISFTLACWQVSDEVLVINGFAHGERANRTQLELLSNILRAIGQLSANLPAAELIEWPLSPGAESTLDGAKTQLSMFLLGRQQVRPYRWLLAMGDEPACLLSKAESESPTESGSAETLFIPSLQSMLAEPLCKREVWQALRHLRGA